LKELHFWYLRLKTSLRLHKTTTNKHTNKRTIE
jgi:hypothetical protein